MDIPRPDNFNETYLYEGTFFQNRCHAEGLGTLSIRG